MAGEAKHTPGPWRFTRVDINVAKIGVYQETTAGRMDALWSDATGNAVAVPAHPAQHGFGSFGLTEADANLVAAAPDMHGALTTFKKQWEACGPNSDFGRYFKNVYVAACAALSRAGGES